MASVQGLEGEDEWEEASMPGTENGTQKPELCPTPSGIVGGDVGGAVGHSELRIAGPKAKVGRASPCDTTGPVCLGTARSPHPISQSKWGP